jgi:hypothetical protein
LGWFLRRTGKDPVVVSFPVTLVSGTSLGGPASNPAIRAQTAHPPAPASCQSLSSLPPFRGANPVLPPPPPQSSLNPGKRHRSWLRPRQRQKGVVDIVQSTRARARHTVPALWHGPAKVYLSVAPAQVFVSPVNPAILKSELPTRTSYTHALSSALLGFWSCIRAISRLRIEFTAMLLNTE